MTMTSMGRHQKMVEFVFNDSTFRSTHFFIPLNYCLKPMFVPRLRNTTNCYLGYTSMIDLFTFIRKGVSLSAIVFVISRSGCSSSR